MALRIEGVPAHGKQKIDAIANYVELWGPKGLQTLLFLVFIKN